MILQSLHLATDYEEDPGFVEAQVAEESSKSPKLNNCPFGAEIGINSSRTYDLHSP